MANLSKAQLRKDDREVTLLKKFFSLPHHMNIFAVKGKQKEGQFVPVAMVFWEGNKEVAAIEADEKEAFPEALARIRDIMEKSNGKVTFTGNWQNDNSVSTVNLTELEKTEEFGGQVGGKRVNLGIQFEKDFYKSLNCLVQCLCEHTKYEAGAKDLVKKINDEYRIPGGLSNVDGDVAAQNQKRPLKTGNGGIVVGTGTKNIGSTVTDITTTFGGKKDIYLSLKYGNTLTFINSGVKNIFKESDYKTFFDGYKDPIGTAIFEMFNIDKVEYAKVFNDYGKGYKGKKVDVTSTAKKKKIQDLLEYAIGYGYWMVHGKGGSSVDCYEITKSYMEKAAAPTGTITLHYGGSTGKGKRLDIHMESNVYKFMWNLRNKQGGKYPTHIMCDYKKK
tara:strand:+ start:58 stop:1224 length:1167 start_codon:yes stop_codon:yes gene_type:complete